MGTKYEVNTSGEVKHLGFNRDGNIIFFEDFLSFTSSNWGSVSSGSATAATTDGHGGVGRLDTGGTANSVINRFTESYMFNTAKPFTLEIRIKWNQVGSSFQSDSTAFGFADWTKAAGTVAHDGNQNTGAIILQYPIGGGGVNKVQAYTIASDVASSLFELINNPVSGQYYKFKVEATTTSVKISLNDVLLHTITTNIPTVGMLFFLSATRADGGNRSFDVDYVKITYTK